MRRVPLQPRHYRYHQLSATFLLAQRYCTTYGNTTTLLLPNIITLDVAIGTHVDFITASARVKLMENLEDVISATRESTHVPQEQSTATNINKGTNKHSNSNSKKNNTKSAEPAKRKLRILCLHGHAMSGELMRSKIGSIRNETKSLVRKDDGWLFPDGPLDSRSAEPQGYFKSSPFFPQNTAQKGVEECADDGAATEQSAQQEQPTMYSWVDFSQTIVSHNTSTDQNEQGSHGKNAPEAEEQQEKEDLSVDEHGRSKEVSKLRKYGGLKESLQALEEYCASHGPFDGVFGFSQGAMLAALIVARLFHNQNNSQKTGANGNITLPCAEAEHQQPFYLPPTLKAQPFRFFIFVSGLLPRDPTWRAEVLSAVPPPSPPSTNSDDAVCDSRRNDGHCAFLPPLKTLHCWGAADGLIIPAESEALRNASLFVAPETAIHDGGHVVNSSLRKPIKAFLQSVVDEL